MNFWDPHTKKLKYCSSENSDEHNNKFGKGWLPGSELMNGMNIFTLSKFKIDPSDQAFIKDDIFEVNAIFHQEVLILELLHHTLNIITCHIYLSQKQYPIVTLFSCKKWYQCMDP